MAKPVLLKLNDEIFKETEEIISQTHISRNAYINQALSIYNKLNRRRALKKLLKYESGLVRHNSLELLEEFERLEDEMPG
jgi:hypothetical protein